MEEIDNEKKDNKKILLISAIVIAIILIIGILSTSFALLNINNSGIVSGITIKGINVQGLSKEQAIQKISVEINQGLDKDIVVKSGEFETVINPSQIEAKYNIEEIVEEIYSIGRSGNIFRNNFDIMKVAIVNKNIEPELTYDEELLDEIVTNIELKVPDAVVEPSYYIEEKKLIITKGVVGNTINKEETKNLIISRIENDDEKSMELNLIKITPSEIDINKIYNEIYKEPKDAYYTEDPFQLFVHVDGIKFNLEVAKEMMKEDKLEYVIDLIITQPEITTSKIGSKAFPDLISSFTTKYDASNISRTTNLELASEKLNEVIVMPDEVFSYNQTLGKRTIEEGYKEALRIYWGESSSNIRRRNMSGIFYIV